MDVSCFLKTSKANIIIIIIINPSPSPSISSYSQEFCNLIIWILRVDPAERPIVVEIEQRISSLLANRQDSEDV